MNKQALPRAATQLNLIKPVLLKRSQTENWNATRLIMAFGHTRSCCLDLERQPAFWRPASQQFRRSQAGSRIVGGASAVSIVRQEGRAFRGGVCCYFPRWGVASTWNSFREKASKKTKQNKTRHSEAYFLPKYSSAVYGSGWTGYSGEHSHDPMQFNFFFFFWIFVFSIHTDDKSDGLNVLLIYDLLMACWAAASGDFSLLLSQPLREETVNDQQEVNCP